LIANPGAGKVLEAASNLEEVTRILMEKGIKVDVALAHPIRKAIPIARKAVEDGYDMVIAMGGDGTIGAVIRGVARSKVKFGIIPAGTANDFAASLGIPEDMKAACDLIVSGKTRKIDLGQIKTKKEKFVFFMTVAVGLTATLYPMVNEVPEGKIGGLKDAVKSFLKFDPEPEIYLTLDDESEIKVESMLVTITNTPLIGLKNLVAPDATLDDGLLDIAVYPEFSKADLLSYFAKSVGQRKTSDKSIQRYRARKLKIKTSPKLDIAAEGIILGKGKAKIKVLPGALRVIAPEPGAGAEKPQEQAATDLPTPVSPVAKEA
jgi:diacylglycerol kinase (ATP)